MVRATYIIDSLASVPGNAVIAKKVMGDMTRRYCISLPAASSPTTFARQTTAATTTEYAILLALVVIGVLVAGVALSHATRDSLTEIALLDSSASADFSSDDFFAESAGDAAEATRQTAAGTRILERLAILFLLLTCCYLIRRQRNARRERTPSTCVAEPQSPEELQVYLKRQQIYHILSSNMESLFNSQMQVQHLMSKRVTTVRPRSTVARMKHLMKQKQVRHLLVCDEQQHLLGIVSDRDLYRDDALTAQQVMTPNPITVPPDALVGAVISLLLKEQISALPIVQDDRLCGLMTTTDLIMAMQCALQLWRQVAEEMGANAASPPSSNAADEPAAPSPVEQPEFEMVG